VLRQVEPCVHDLERKCDGVGRSGHSSTGDWILDSPVNARGLAAMRRGDVLAGEQAVAFHVVEEHTGSFGGGNIAGAVDIACRDEVPALLRVPGEVAMVR